MSMLGMQNNQFSKAERLYLKQDIERLFSQGKAFTAYPLRVIYLLEKCEATKPVQILISVPKRNFKHAADRNRVKRLVRENYRLSKHSLSNTLMEKGYALKVAFICVIKDLPSYDIINKAMLKALSRLDKYCLSDELD